MTVINKVPKLNPIYRLQWESAQDCFVLLYPEGMVKLSQSAGEIMKRIDGESNVASIVESLEAAFAGAELRNDVISFLSDAENNGWLNY